MSQRVRLLSFFATGLALLALAPASAAAAPFLGGLSMISPVGKTVPPNGDENPYGVAPVPRSVGSLVAGDTLVSNFNNGENLQGTGTTISELSPSGAVAVFAEIKASSLHGSCPGGVGLTTALAILPTGDVVVGSLPTSDGTSSTAHAGCLILLNSVGKPIETIAGRSINGPWDLAASNLFGGAVTVLYVANVLNGTVAAEPNTVFGGTVVRLVLLNVPGRAPVVIDRTVIAEGFPERTDEAALVVGPTGLAVSGSSLNQTVYVADTDRNRIAEVPNALLRRIPVTGAGRTVTEGGDLEDPLGMALAPNGNILTANGGENSKIVETSPAGSEVASFDTEVGEGGLFGLAVTLDQHGILFVNDNENELNLLH